MIDRNLELTNRMIELNLRIDRLEDIMITEDYKEKKFDTLQNLRTQDYLWPKISEEGINDKRQVDLEKEINELNKKINELKKSIENDMFKKEENNGSN